MKRSVYLLFILVFLPFLLLANSRTSELTSYVNPYIGTGGEGYVFLGANVPYGFIQLGPTNISANRWGNCSGYAIGESTIYGFGHTHLSGTGVGDLGDIQLMPFVGKLKLPRNKEDRIYSTVYSSFDRKSEIVKPGFYGVHLDRSDVDVSLTATERTGFHKYIFRKAAGAGILVNLADGIGWDYPKKGFIEQENSTTLSGYRFSGGWATNKKLFFTMRFSKPIVSMVVSDSTVRMDGDRATGKRIYVQLGFDIADGDSVMVKVALSAVSIDNAKMNMDAELRGWDFRATVAKADSLWNDELGKIRIATQDRRIKQLFYTSFFHLAVAPSLFCDVNNDYRGSDGQIYRGAKFKNYTTFSLWDTYRAVHPLLSLIEGQRVDDMINTMIGIYRQQGKLPIWHFMGCETNCMVGNPAIPIISDAIMKGYKGFDVQEAYEAMKNTAMRNEPDINLLKQYSYIPFDKDSVESVSKCLEYAMADGCLARVARRLGKPADYNYFHGRSLAYRHYFDRKTGFMRAVATNGKFRLPFDPVALSYNKDYTEGNAWQYTFMVPHDPEGLIALFGGKHKFLDKLDSLFVVKSPGLTKEVQGIGGFIGQYAHGNEPSHHILYLYAYAGAGWKSATKIRTVLNEFYTNKATGLCGNEDVGQMSAWYMLSAMGLYQLEPAGGKYVFGSPIIDRADIRLKNGKVFSVIARNNSAKHPYIASVRLNGKPYHKFYIDYRDLMAGGQLEFMMSAKHPN